MDRLDGKILEYLEFYDLKEDIRMGKYTDNLDYWSVRKEGYLEIDGIPCRAFYLMSENEEHADCVFLNLNSLEEAEKKADDFINRYYYVNLNKEYLIEILESHLVERIISYPFYSNDDDRYYYTISIDMKPGGRVNMDLSDTLDIDELEGICEGYDVLFV